MKRQSGVKRLIGVGVGPGDPELVTVKAVRVLREADAVLVPVLAGTGAEPAGPGRAETIIRAYVGADRIRRLEFALNDTGGITPRRAAAWQAAAAAVAEEFAAGADSVAFGTLGDPNLYSTFSYLAQAVAEIVPEVTVQTVAGITAMQDLASRAGISLAEGTEPVTLVPLNGGIAALDQALARGGTVVGYKVGAAASPAPAVLTARLQAAGRLEAAVIGARLGLEGELIAPAADLLPPAPSTSPAPAVSSAPALEFNESDSLPDRGGRESLSTESPASPQADIPDIPYLSTLIVPALRAAGIGAGLTARPGETQAPPEPEVTATLPAAPSPNRDDVTSPWSEPPQMSHRRGCEPPPKYPGPATKPPQPVTAANRRDAWCSWERARARRICSPSAARAPSPPPTSSSGRRAWSTSASWPTRASMRRSSTRRNFPWKACCPTTSARRGTS